VTTETGVRHIIVIIEENHSFDFYFGQYCTASPYSNPTCNTGPACCEKAPANFTTSSNAVSNSTILTTQVFGSGCGHAESNTVAYVNNGSWNGWGTGCFSVSAQSNIPKYFDWASKYALADRYFQPAAGASYEGAAFHAFASYAFSDNSCNPSACTNSATSATYGGTNGCSLGVAFSSSQKKSIGGELDKAGIPWTMYWDGSCSGYIPFAYASDVNQQKHFKSSGSTPPSQIVSDIKNGLLPPVIFVKPSDLYNGKKGMAAEETHAAAILDAVLASSKYKDNTLVFITHDEHGGFYDHVKRGGTDLPLTNKFDGKTYGPRLPALGMGNVVKSNYISHVPMEPTSITKFIEYNWLNGITGQLGTRDAQVSPSINMIDDIIKPELLPIKLGGTLAGPVSGNPFD